MKKSKIFLTGGAGYCGSLLVPRLLEKNYKVTVYDTLFFGDNFLPKSNQDLKIIQGDIRDVNKLEETTKDHDYFISLACISNDASFELNENLSTSINMDAFEPMVKIAKKNKIKRFIYASSSSVYGVSEKKDVKEDHPLVPLTLYNKYKGLCEPILKKYTDNEFIGVIFRPATVCGYAPRLRLDLSVNILTNHAITNNIIKVFGGEQLRPNLHVKDYCRAIELLLSAPSNKVNNEIFNVGFQNLSILELAQIVKQVVEEEFNLKNKINIVRTSSDDLRSYHINSDKIFNALGFKPKYSIEDAVRDLCTQYKLGKIKDSMNDDIYFNVKRIKNLQVS